MRARATLLATVVARLDRANQYAAPPVVVRGPCDYRITIAARPLPRCILLKCRKPGMPGSRSLRAG